MHPWVWDQLFRQNLIFLIFVPFGVRLGWLFDRWSSRKWRWVLIIMQTKEYGMGILNIYFVAFPTHLLSLCKHTVYSNSGAHICNFVSDTKGKDDSGRGLSLGSNEYLLLSLQCNCSTMWKASDFFNCHYVCEFELCWYILHPLLIHILIPPCTLYRHIWPINLIVAIEGKVILGF